MRGFIAHVVASPGGEADALPDPRPDPGRVRVPDVDGQIDPVGGTRLFAVPRLGILPTDGPTAGVSSPLSEPAHPTTVTNQA